MHTDFDLDWTNILGAFIKKLGFSFFLDHPVGIVLQTKVTMKKGSYLDIVL